jgi:putative ABC transport system permease protein
MLLHYFKIAWRNLERQKMLTLINVSGLSIGIACFSLFLLYAVHEFSYDRFHVNAANIHRVYSWWKFDGREGSEPASATPIGPAMKNDLTDVEDFVRIQGGGAQLVRARGEVHRVSLSFADPQIFSVFTFPLLSGDAKTALIDPHYVVLTRSKAMQLFGEINVVGEPIEIKTDKGLETFTVSAIAEDIPVNSSISFGILGSMDHLLATEMGRASSNSWTMTIGISIYVLLKPGSTLMHDEEKIASFRQKYFQEEDVVPKKKGGQDEKSAHASGYGLQPITDVHTGSKIDPWNATNATNIWILLAIAGSILLIACINFVVLAIGRSAGRSREVGVRKVIGSTRKRLVSQFLAESLLLTVLSALLGLVAAQALLPFFNELSGRSLSFSFVRYPEMAGWLAGAVLLAGLLAGSYPAFVLSSFKPVDALKNTIRVAGSNLFTKSLVTFQFVVSMVLIVSMVVILKQLSFMQSMNLGFDKENVVMISASDADREKVYPLFRQALIENTEILGITGSDMGMGAGEGQMGRGYDFNGKVQGVIEYPVDENFLKVLDMRIVAGRNFDPSITSDTVSSVIVNEALVRNALNTTPDKALGMEIRSPKGGTSKIVIGVIKDFNFEALTRAVRPQLFLQPAKFGPSAFFVRLKPGDPSSALEQIQSAWKEVANDLPFRYSFLDDKFDAFYKSEQRWGSIVAWAGNITVFLACLGLFGLTSLAVVNRTKEIGIRKILGASVINVVSLLSTHFAKLIIIAILIASPVAWYATSRWLEAFAYRIDLSWWIFLVTGASIMIIALTTVAVQVLKAALMDPVNSLRSE